MSLLFSFRELLEELDAFQQISQAFVEAGAEGVINELRESLKNFRDAEAGRRLSWEIRHDYPLVTKPSRGYVGSGGRFPVWASFTCLWQISPVGNNSPKNPNRTLALDGKASTQVRFWKGDRYSPDFLSMWRMEIGADDSPGSYFHVQILGESNDAPFPRWLDVPRLPGFIATPPQVMEFAIGELFQREWPSSLGSTYGFNTWRRIQRGRFERFLKWQKQALDDGSGSPWIDIKLAKPDREIFVS